jgi:hypothetical protein
MRSIVRGSALIALAEGSQSLYAPAPVYTAQQQAYGNPAYVQQAYGNPAYVQLVDGAQSPIMYMQPMAGQPVSAEQGTAWSDIAMLAVMGAAVGGAIGYATKARAGNAQMIDLPAEFEGIWGFDAKKWVYEQWDPEKPRTYENFNPFERNDESAMCDTNGCFPGQSRGYKSPLRPDQSWDIMQKERAAMDELGKEAKFNSKGKPGNFTLKWQEKLGAPP